MNENAGTKEARCSVYCPDLAQWFSIGEADPLAGNPARPGHEREGLFVAFWNLGQVTAGPLTPTYHHPTTQGFDRRKQAGDCASCPAQR